MKNKFLYSTKKLARSSAISFILKGISLLLSMATSSLALQALGDYKYGVLASILSIVSWIYTFDLGIGTGLKNKLAASLGINDYYAARNYIGISYLLTILISLAFLLGAFIAFPFIDISTLLGINSNGENINLVVIIAVGFVCFNFITINVQSIIYAIQKSELVNAYALVGQVCYAALLYLAITKSINSLLYIVIVQGISQVLKNVIATIHIFYQESDFRPKIFHLDWNYKNGLIAFGLQAFAVQIAAAVLNFTDNLVITKCIDASAVTPYSFCYKFFGIISSVYTIILTPFWVSYPMAYEKNDKNWMIKTLRRSTSVTVLFGLGAIIAIFVFKPFSKIWLGRILDYQENLVLLTAIYFILQMISTNFASLCMGTGKIKRLFMVNIFQAVTNVPISVFLAVDSNMGVNGVIMGSIIVMAVGAAVAISHTLQIIKEM